MNNNVKQFCVTAKTSIPRERESRKNNLSLERNACLCGHAEVFDVIMHKVICAKCFAIIINVRQLSA